MRFKYKAFYFVQKKNFAVRFRNKFPAKGCQRFFIYCPRFRFYELFCPNVGRKTAFSTLVVNEISKIRHIKNRWHPFAGNLSRNRTAKNVFEQNKTLCTWIAPSEALWCYLKNSQLCIIDLCLTQNQIQHCIPQINNFLTISILFLWHKFSRIESALPKRPCKP